MALSQPNRVIITRPSTAQMLCVSTMARPTGMISKPERKISARLARNSSAISRNADWLANTASPITSMIGPISLAMKTDVDIGYPSHAAWTSCRGRTRPHPSRSDERATLPRKREREDKSEARSLSRLRGRVGVGALLCLISRCLHVLAEPGAHPRVGIGVLGDVADDGDGIGAGGENRGRLFELDAADRHQRKRADALFPFGDLRDALRREPHRFQRGRKNRTERDVIGFGAQCGFELGIVMGGKA